MSSLIYGSHFAQDLIVEKYAGNWIYSKKSKFKIDCHLAARKQPFKLFQETLYTGDTRLSGPIGMYGSLSIMPSKTEVILRSGQWYI